MFLFILCLCSRRLSDLFRLELTSDFLTRDILYLNAHLSLVLLYKIVLCNSCQRSFAYRSFDPLSALRFVSVVGLISDLRVQR